MLPQETCRSEGDSDSGRGADSGYMTEESKRPPSSSSLPSPLASVPPQTSHIPLIRPNVTLPTPSGAAATRGNYSPVARHEDEEDTSEELEERHELLVDDSILLGPRRRSLSPGLVTKRGKSPSGSTCSSRRTPVIV